MSDPAAERERSGVSLTALSVAQAARLFAKLGARYATEARIREDLAKGAPANPDGTLNLVHYAAWLIKERA